jgi:predicted HTH domain antitoxin
VILTAFGLLFERVAEVKMEIAVEGYVKGKTSLGKSP